MNILRRLGLAICLGLFGLGVLGLAWAHVFSATVRDREVVKTWAAESGIYDKAVDAVLEAAAKQSEEPGAESLPIEDEGIREIARDAFDKEFLKQSAEEVVNGAYSWLEGDTPGPEFSIDLSDAKSRLAKGLGEHAEKLAKDLPECSRAKSLSMAGEDIDVWNAECRPIGLSPAAIGKDVRSQIESSDKFLGDVKLSGADIKVKENGKELPLALSEQSKHIQRGYKVGSYGPLVFAIIAALSGTGIVLLSPTRVKGTKRLGFALLTNGVLLGISYLLLAGSSGWLKGRAKDVSGDLDAGQEIATNLFGLIAGDFAKILLAYTLVILVLGVVCLFLPGKLGWDEPVSPTKPAK